LIFIEKGGDNIGAKLYDECPHCGKKIRIELSFGSSGWNEVDLWVHTEPGDEVPENAGEEKRDSWPHA